MEDRREQQRRPAVRARGPLREALQQEEVAAGRVLRGILEQLAQLVHDDEQPAARGTVDGREGALEQAEHRVVTRCRAGHEGVHERERVVSDRREGVGERAVRRGAREPPRQRARQAFALPADEHGRERRREGRVEALGQTRIGGAEALPRVGAALERAGREQGEGALAAAVRPDDGPRAGRIRRVERPGEAAHRSPRRRGHDVAVERLFGVDVAGEVHGAAVAASERDAAHAETRDAV